MLPPKFRIVVPRVGYLNWFENVWLLPTKCMLCNTFPCLQSSNLIGFSPIKSIDNLLVYILVGFVRLFKFKLLACNMQKGFELPIYLNVAVWLCLIVFDVITSRKNNKVYNFCVFYLSHEQFYKWQEVMMSISCICMLYLPYRKKTLIAI